MIEGARRIRLELAADWLVMAAWLTWLKSRLLLPAGSEAAEEGELAADVLAARLRDLQAIRAAAAWLGRRGRSSGRRCSPAALPEELTETDRSRLAARPARAAARLSGGAAARRRHAALSPAAAEPVERAGRAGPARRHARQPAGLDQPGPLPAAGARRQPGAPRRPGQHPDGRAGAGARRRAARCDRSEPFGPILVRRAGEPQGDAQAEGQ